MDRIAACGAVDPSSTLGRCTQGEVQEWLIWSLSKSDTVLLHSRGFESHPLRMLLVKTYLSSSKIQGIGLFADEEINEGTITWRYRPGFDLSFTEEDVEHMPRILRDYFQKYASLSLKTGKYVLSGDDSRFINHSSNSNLEAFELDDDLELASRAKKDIDIGEELTIDYRSFDKDSLVSKKSYLR